MFVSNGIRPARYQLVALTKLLENGAGGILVADGVGVGKTISASYIALYAIVLSRKPALAICPPTLIPKWVEELKSKFRIRTFPIRSMEDLETARRESSSPGSRAHAYVMSNSILNTVKRSQFPPISAIIFDEIHNFRNPETQSFRSCLEISQLGEFRIGLSATPINNSINDLVSELNILLPRFKWGALQAAVEEAWGQDRARLTLPFVTRFTKDRLGIQFARRRVETRSIRYDSDYIQRVKSLIADHRHNRSKRGSFYDEVTYYRMAASSPYAFLGAFGVNWKGYHDPKVIVLKEILSLEQLSHWLIFCEFEDTVSYLEQNLAEKNCFTLTGGTPMSERSSIISSFKRTQNAALIMTSVGSEGLDLQFCNGIINYDIHWNPMRLEQRVGRIDRVGQEKNVVIVYNIIVRGSVDERVVRVIRKKLELIHGSVFAPESILGTLPIGERSQGIFDEVTLERELGQSNGLLTSLRLSREVQPYDYGIVPKVKLEYCWPPALSNSAEKFPLQTRWLESDRETNGWLEGIKTNALEFTKLVKYYS